MNSESALDILNTKVITPLRVAVWFDFDLEFSCLIMPENIAKGRLYKAPDPNPHMNINKAHKIKLTEVRKRARTAKRPAINPTPTSVIKIYLSKVLVIPHLFAERDKIGWDSIAPSTKSSNKIDIWFEVKWKE